MIPWKEFSFLQFFSFSILRVGNLCNQTHAIYNCSPGWLIPNPNFQFDFPTHRFRPLVRPFSFWLKKSQKLDPSKLDPYRAVRVQFFDGSKIVFLDPFHNFSTHHFEFKKSVFFVQTQKKMNFLGKPKYIMKFCDWNCVEISANFQPR